MSCRVGLLRLHWAGLIALLPPRNGNGNGRGLVRQPLDWPTPEPVMGPLRELSGVQLEAVTEQRASRLYNGLMDRWPALGYRLLPGAQLR